VQSEIPFETSLLLYDILLLLLDKESFHAVLLKTDVSILHYFISPFSLNLPLPLCLELLPPHYVLLHPFSRSILDRLEFDDSHLLDFLLNLLVHLNLPPLRLDLVPVHFGFDYCCLCLLQLLHAIDGLRLLPLKGVDATL
jgi:hypothetical protein